MKSKNNCGSDVKATSTFLIVACPKNGVLEVISLNDMSTVYKSNE